jgi:RsiW-degrading membrane proteinase PrsW (M82 family)
VTSISSGVAIKSFEMRKRPKEPKEYELKIDAQVEKYFEIKQKLTYFLITASVAIITFLANFVFKYRSEAKYLFWLIIVSCIAGLVTSGLSLLNLHFEHKSYRLHLKYRYEQKTWDSLNEKDKKKWDSINKLAGRFLVGAFVALFIEITFAVTFFILFF